jgi:hypothetical protein
VSRCLFFADVLAVVKFVYLCTYRHVCTRKEKVPSRALPFTAFIVVIPTSCYRASMVSALGRLGLRQFSRRIAWIGGGSRLDRLPGARRRDCHHDTIAPSRFVTYFCPYCMPHVLFEIRSQKLLLKFQRPDVLPLLEKNIHGHRVSASSTPSLQQHHRFSYLSMMPSNISDLETVLAHIS